MTKKIAYITSYLFVFIFLTFISIVVVSAAFTGPSANPPDGDGVIKVDTGAPAASLELNASGEIVTGIWKGSTLGVGFGGTGLGTLTANNVILGNGTSNPLFVAPGTFGNVLTSNGTTWTSLAPTGGGVETLSELTIDTDKDWQGHGITNLGDLNLSETSGPLNPARTISTGGSTDLDLASGGDVLIGGGLGKLTAGTFDPPYTIGGKKYATYLSGMVGQMEETTGVATLHSSRCESIPISLRTLDEGGANLCESTNIYEYVIDFNKVDEGSDLWLFAQTININARDYFDEGTGKTYSTTNKKISDNMTVLLTPGFNGKVWYEKDFQNKRIMIFAVPTNEQSSYNELEISYRLTAPRFDAKMHGNYRKDNSSEGFNLDKLLK